MTAENRTEMSTRMESLGVENCNIPETVERYRHALLERERSSATIQKYTADARAFLLWTDGRPITKELVVAWKQGLQAAGQAPATINARICAVNGLLRHLGLGDCTLRLLKIQPDTVRNPKKELTRKEYRALVYAAEHGGKKDLALLLETMASTGIRVSELPFITAEAVRRGEAVISLKGKNRRILLPTGLAHKLMKFIRRRKITSGPVFLNASGEAMNRFQVWAALKSLCAAAGVEAEKCFPHNLRRLFAVTFYRSCSDISRLADLMGHSSIQTTRIYLTATAQEQIRLLDALNLVL